MILHGGILCTKEDRDEIALAEPSAMMYMLDLHVGVHTGSLKDVHQRGAGCKELTQVVKEAAGDQYRFMCCMNKANQPNQHFRVSRVRNNMFTTNVDVPHRIVR